MITFVRGDAVTMTSVSEDGEASDNRDRTNVIAHIVNNQGGWGKGFVVALADKFPVARDCYRIWANHKSLNDYMTITPEVFGLGHTQFVTVSRDIVVANMCAQSGYKNAGNPVPLSYPALGLCLDTLFKFSAVSGARIHMPRIGCGLAGGDWHQVEGLMREVGENFVPSPDIFVYDLQQ